MPRKQMSEVRLMLMVTHKTAARASVVKRRSLLCNDVLALHCPLPLRVAFAPLEGGCKQSQVRILAGLSSATAESKALESPLTLSAQWCNLS